MDVQFKNEITFSYYFSLLLSNIVDGKPNLNSRVQETKVGQDSLSLVKQKVSKTMRKIISL